MPPAVAARGGPSLVELLAAVGAVAVLLFHGGAAVRAHQGGFLRRLGKPSTTVPAKTVVGVRHLSAAEALPLKDHGSLGPAFVRILPMASLGYSRVAGVSAFRPRFG